MAIRYAVLHGTTKFKFSTGTRSVSWMAVSLVRMANRFYVQCHDARGNRRAVAPDLCGDDER